MTKHAGIDRRRNAAAGLPHGAPEVKLVALFPPDRGIRGAQDHEKIGDTTREKTGLQVFSLYGERRNPSSDQLKSIDTEACDIQDIGSRFHTDISTMANFLEAAGKAKIGHATVTDGEDSWRHGNAGGAPDGQAAGGDPRHS